MKFTCDKNQLTNAISIVLRTVSPKSSLAAIEGILLRGGERLALTGYNLETGITVEVDAAIREPGECIMPARMFFDIVRKLPDDQVRVEVDEKLRVRIQGGISSFAIMANQADDYPDLPSVRDGRQFVMEQGKLRRLIGGTIFAVSTEMSKPIHTGCLMELEGEKATMVGVDGFRLARKSAALLAPAEQNASFVVPSPALKELEKILDDGEDPVRLSLGDRHLLFTVGDATLVCRLIDGTFLDWRRVIPVNNPIKLTANVAELTSTLERVGLIVSEKFKSPVRCRFVQDGAEFSTTTTVASAKDGCRLAGAGRDLEIGFNCRYLLDALKAVPTDEVVLELSNPLSPIVMTPCTPEEDFSYMVLPVRLKAGD